MLSLLIFLWDGKFNGGTFAGQTVHVEGSAYHIHSFFHGHESPRLFRGIFVPLFD